MRMHKLLIPLLLLGFLACEEQPTVDEDKMKSIFEAARELDAEGRYHEAMVMYESILAVHPTWMSTRLNAAMAAYDSGQYTNAVGHFELLHKYGPTDWFVIRKLIQCYERLKRIDKVDAYRAKLADLRKRKDGSEVLKKYEGFTRDYIPIGTKHMIGYEFFDPQKHGRLWFFKLENHHRKPISSFLVEASPFHTNKGHRIFYITEFQPGWMRVWHIGEEGRKYQWSREFVMAILQGKHRPLVVKPLPAGLMVQELPGRENPDTAAPETQKGDKKEGSKEDQKKK